MDSNYSLEHWNLIYCLSLTGLKETGVSTILGDKDTAPDQTSLMGALQIFNSHYKASFYFENI